MLYKQAQVQQACSSPDLEMLCKDSCSVQICAIIWPIARKLVTRHIPFSCGLGVVYMRCVRHAIPVDRCARGILPRGV